MAILKKSTPHTSQMKIIPDEQDIAKALLKNGAIASTESLTDAVADENVGKLSVDIFQTAKEIVVVAPIAGVTLQDISITVQCNDRNEQVLQIRGQRFLHFKVDPSEYFTQECFWGDFSRSIIMPDGVDVSGIKASFKNGVLVIRIPKVEIIRTRTVKISEK